MADDNGLATLAERFYVNERDLDPLDRPACPACTKYAAGILGDTYAFVTLTEIEQLRSARHYVERNLAVWGETHDLVSVAAADVFQKILNVMDTGSPILHDAYHPPLSE